MQNTLSDFIRDAISVWNGGESASKFSPPNMPRHHWLGALGIPITNSQNAADETVGPEICEAIPAYFSCINVGSQDIMKVPVAVYEPKDKGKARVDSSSDEIAFALEVQANDLMSSAIFRRVMTTNAMGWGQAFAEIVVNKLTGRVSMWPIHPSRIMPRYYEQGRKKGQFRDWEVLVDDLGEEKSKVFLDEQQVFRIIGYTHDGINGISPAQTMPDSMGGAKAAEITAAALFGNGCNIRGVFEHPDKLSDEAYEHLRTSMNDVYTGGRNAYKAMILEEDMKFKGITMPMKDAQLLESRQYSARQMCQIHRIIPSKIFDFDQGGYNSRESDHQAHKDDFILSWAVVWENEIKRKLYPNSPRFALFVMDSLLRGNRKERFEGHKLATEGGWKTTNEVRLEEGDNPKEQHGDEYYMTVQAMSEKNLHEKHDVEIEILKQELENLKNPPEPPPMIGMEPPKEEEEEEKKEEEKEEKKPQDSRVSEDKKSSAHLELILDRDIDRWVNRENKAVSRHLSEFDDWYVKFYTDKEISTWANEFSVVLQKMPLEAVENYFEASIQAIMESGEYDQEFHKLMLKEILNGKN
jgi:HK97 family phage portal protein